MAGECVKRQKGETSCPDWLDIRRKTTDDGNCRALPLVCLSSACRWSPSPV